MSHRGTPPSQTALSLPLPVFEKSPEDPPPNRTRAPIGLGCHFWPPAAAELEPQQLRETMNPELWGSYWSIEVSSNAKAFEYLSRLDLGPAFDPNAKSDVAGEIQFLDCPGICCHYRGVETYDLVSISLLQNRLNELGEPTRVAMFEP